MYFIKQYTLLYALYVQCKQKNYSCNLFLQEEKWFMSGINCWRNEQTDNARISDCSTNLVVKVLKGWDFKPKIDVIKATEQLNQKCLRYQDVPDVEWRIIGMVTITGLVFADERVSWDHTETEQKSPSYAVPPGTQHFVSAMTGLKLPRGKGEGLLKCWGEILKTSCTQLLLWSTVSKVGMEKENKKKNIAQKDFWYDTNKFHVMQSMTINLVSLLMLLKLGISG